MQIAPWMWTSSNCRSVRTSTSSAPFVALEPHLVGVERGRLYSAGQQRAAVERHDLLEVRRLGSQSSKGLLDELLLVLDRECRVVLMLVPAVEQIFMSMPGPPHIEPPRCAGHSSQSPGSVSSRWCTERKIWRAPSACSTAKSVRATSPTNRLSPLSTAHGSPPRVVSISRKAVCSGRCPGVCRARTVSDPKRSSHPSSKGSCS